MFVECRKILLRIVVDQIWFLLIVLENFSCNLSFSKAFLRYSSQKAKSTHTKNEIFKWVKWFFFDFINTQSVTKQNKLFLSLFFFAEKKASRKKVILFQHFNISHVEKCCRACDEISGVLQNINLIMSESRAELFLFFILPCVSLFRHRREASNKMLVDNKVPFSSKLALDRFRCCLLTEKNTANNQRKKKGKSSIFPFGKTAECWRTDSNIFAFVLSPSPRLASKSADEFSY